MASVHAQPHLSHLFQRRDEPWECRTPRLCGYVQVMRFTEEKYVSAEGGGHDSAFGRSRTRDIDTGSTGRHTTTEHIIRSTE